MQRYLRKLRTIGLVDATEMPSAILYRLNRSHVFWQPIEDILAAPARIEEEIVLLVQEKVGLLARVAVFGSVARGSAGALSDYDVLLVVDDSVLSRVRADTVVAVVELVERLTGNMCQVVDVSESELRSLLEADSSLAHEWQKGARAIDGRGGIAQLKGTA